MTTEKSDTPLTDAFMLQRAWVTPDKQFPDVQELIEHARSLERRLRAVESAQAPQEQRAARAKEQSNG